MTAAVLQDEQGTHLTQTAPQLSKSGTDFTSTSPPPCSSSAFTSPKNVARKTLSWGLLRTRICTFSSDTS